MITPDKTTLGRKSVLVGIFRIARGRADGFALFGDSPQAFLSSLAPLIAFPVVGGVLMLLGGGGMRAIGDLLATICALLAPPVFSFTLAKAWGREAAWPRYAVAFNWCQWALPVVGCIMLVLLAFAMASGLPQRTASEAFIMGLGAYGLWLHWFLVRRGLSLSIIRSILFVVAINLATIFLVIGPRLLAMDRG